MKVTCKKTGKNMTGKVIENIERKMISEGIKLFKVTFTRDEDGNLVQHKTQIKYDQYWIILTNKNNKYVRSIRTLE